MEVSMNARQWMTTSLLLAGAVAAFWLIGTADNPVREAMQVGSTAGRERLAGETTPPLEAFASSLTEPGSAEMTVRGRLYVPAYAQIRLGSGRGKLDLATTLSIHNGDVDQPVVLRRISYHATDGRLVETLLDRPVALKPLATVEFFVPADDLRAGSGANFVVEWAASARSMEPIAEAVMIGTIGTTSYSFVSQGRAAKVASVE
jgi:hypothetical protein